MEQGAFMPPFCMSTTLLREGVNGKISLTLDTNAHVLPDMQSEAADVTERLYGAVARKGTKVP